MICKSQSHGCFFKVTLHSGVDNFLGKARWFYENWRNYANRSFIEVFQVLIQLLNIIIFFFKYYFKEDQFYFSFIRTYISLTLILFALVFLRYVCIETSQERFSLLAKLHNLHFPTVVKNQYLAVSAQVNVTVKVPLTVIKRTVFML